MTEKLGEAPAPFGAPETTIPPGAGGGYFETGRPRLGGLERPIRFSDGQAAVLRAVADTLIPPADGWPTASATDIVTFAGRYVTPAGYRNKHFPFAEEDAFKAGLDQLGSSFVDGDEAARTTAVAALEKAANDHGNPLFEQLRALVYYGYYSRPEVTLAIRRNVPAGKDYHGPPLPYGYLEVTEPWDDETLDAAGGGAGFVATEDVRRVDLSKLSWINGKGA
jgi:Gluconate 2-dehydrogenase subunit 3